MQATASIPKGLPARPKTVGGQPVGVEPLSLASTLSVPLRFILGVAAGVVAVLLTSEAVLGGPSPPATLAATAVLYVLMVGCFVVVVLPHSRVGADRVSAIRRDWTISAAVYLAVLVPLVFAGSQLLVPG